MAEYGDYMYSFLVDGRWPRWATLHPDDVQSELCAEQRGPWVAQQACHSCTLVALHDRSRVIAPVEPPGFILCRGCREALRRANRAPVAPAMVNSRNQGICTKCGGVPRPSRWALSAPAVVLRNAEERGLTVAFLCTTPYCEECRPAGPRRAYCRSRICRQLGLGQHFALSKGCCSQTPRDGNFVHCQAACDRLKKQRQEARERYQSKSPGETNIILSGGSDGSPAGETNIILSGGSDGSPVGETNIILSGGSDGSPAGETNIILNGALLCHAEVCRLNGLGPHLGSRDCCARARQVPHCSVECERQRQVKIAANSRRNRARL